MSKQNYIMYFTKQKKIFWAWDLLCSDGFAGFICWNQTLDSTGNSLILILVHSFHQLADNRNVYKNVFINFLYKWTTHEPQMAAAETNLVWSISSSREKDIVNQFGPFLSTDFYFCITVYMFLNIFAQIMCYPPS